jgi:hypothetical protein
VDGLVLSFELIQLLNWLVKNKPDVLASMIQEAFSGLSTSSRPIDWGDLDAIKAHKSIKEVIDFFDNALARNAVYGSSNKTGNLRDLINLAPSLRALKIKKAAESLVFLIDCASA